MSNKNLWGDLPTGDGIKPPYAVMKEQIAFLEEATDGLLTGNITREVSKSRENHSRLIMYIVAPSLNNYSYAVADVIHPITLYPLKISCDDWPEWMECADETEFLSHLGNILSSPKTRSVVAGLLAQIKAEVA